MATLRDIAGEVGVSIRTVSRALSGSGYVSETLRDRIRTVADRIGYRPDPVAQSLRRGWTSEIVVVSHSVDELHMAKIASLERCARADGLTLSVVMAHREDIANATIATELRARKPAAVVVIGPLEIDVDPLSHALAHEGIICVPVDAPASGSSVQIDRPAGVAEAVRHLLDRGRRRIVYLGPAHSSNRIDGFRAALEDAGRQALLLAPSNHLDRVKTVDELLREYPDVDAIQAFSDEWALELLYGLHRRGVRVPDDIALVGFDDRWAARYSWPALTTVAQPAEAIGEAVLALIGELRAAEPVDRERDGCPSREVETRRIPTRLVVRESA